jgi:cysteine sulfinate desulfinase/cysteine desulfurase-like protein
MMVAEADRKNVLVNKTVAGLKDVIPDVRINGENADRLPGTFNNTLPGVSAESMRMSAHNHSSHLNCL